MWDVFLCFKQKTADEMRISDWSSDVCSSDLSLAYDDALDSQLDNAIPALDRHGFHASFSLPLAADTLRTRLDEWRAAVARGPELGKHPLFPQCSGSGEDRDWVAPHRELGRASCRVRECPSASNSVVAVSLTQQEHFMHKRITLTPTKHPHPI